MTKTKIYSLLLMMTVVSFMGFWIENFFIAFMGGFINNRNMKLPFLLGYGIAILAFYFLFGTPQKPLLFRQNITFETNFFSTLYYFLIAFLCVSIGEIILGYATEWACDIIWWNYTSLPLHITRYTSVPTSLSFAFVITLFMKYGFEPLMSLFGKINPIALAVLSVGLTIVLSLDMLNSAIYMFKNHETQIIWRYDFEKPLKDIIQGMRS